MSIRALVWGEYIHERSDAAVAAIYPQGMHSVIASALAEDAGIAADTATLSDPQHGLTAERLTRTDVLFGWRHKAHGDVVAGAGWLMRRKSRPRRAGRLDLDPPPAKFSPTHRVTTCWRPTGLRI
jgi:hypothetical protein